MNKVSHGTGFGVSALALRFAMVAGLVLALTSVSAGAAVANPFKKVKGSWKSKGATVVINGNKEGITCRAKYKVPGRKVFLNLKCSGPGYFINVDVDARVIGRKVKGNWSEKQFGKSGWVSGKASRKSSNLSFGGGLSGNMTVVLTSGRRHTLHISANGAKARIPMRR